MQELETTRKRAPRWTLAGKPEMVIGGNVPSWTKSIPGPKYDYKTDVYKEKPPVWSMRTKPKMVMGDSVPSWVNSIPGPKYATDINVVKPRQPVYTMQGRSEDPAEKARLKLAASAPTLSQEAIDKGFKETKRKPPSFSLCSKPEMVPGQPVPSWVKSIPGPQYSYSTDVFKGKSPQWSIGEKLPTEADLMSVRSPGPMRYSGPAMDAKTQEQVDSTRHRTPAFGFGVGERWEGKTYELVRSGAFGRYNRPA